MNQSETNEEMNLDLLRFLHILLRKIWVVILIGILSGIIGFSYSKFMITPQYSSEIMLYVNNTPISVENAEVKISSADLTAAQSLAKTYIVLLENRTTIEQVIEKANLPYTYEQILHMIHAAPVDDTEVFSVKVTCDDPYEAEKIVNTIAEVLPERVHKIVEGASMEVVTPGIVNLKKVSPSISKYTFVAALLGMVITIGLIFLSTLLDNRVHDEDYILETYDYPLLAKIPDLFEEDKKSYRTYYRRRG